MVAGLTQERGAAEQQVHGPIAHSALRDPQVSCCSMQCAALLLKTACRSAHATQKLGTQTAGQVVRATAAVHC
jgi:hypothetical protein